MNNLVFNNVASQLKTSIYGQEPNGSFEAIQIDSAGNIKTTITNASLTVAVSNPITIANSRLTVDVVNPITIANSITIANASLTVAVSNPITIANSITITNTNLTVAVSNPITIANSRLTVDVVNPITVANSITIANSSLTVTVGSNAFTSSSVLNVTAIGTNVIMNNTDISNLKTASFLVYNNGLNTLTVSLQLSPTQNDIDYITDPNNQNLTIAPGTGQIIAVDLFAHYARLQYNQGRSSTTISVYFNGQA